MAEVTCEDRAAVWAAYWDDPVRDRCEMSRALHEWLHDGIVDPAVHVTVRLQRLAQDRADVRGRTVSGAG